MKFLLDAFELIIDVGLFADLGCSWFSESPFSDKFLEFILRPLTIFYFEFCNSDKRLIVAGPLVWLTPRFALSDC